MEPIDFQFLFNTAAGLLFMLSGWMFRYILGQYRDEFSRINKRIDELRDSQVESARDARIDHNACKGSLPVQFVPRPEFEAILKRLDDRMSEMSMTLNKIDERLDHVRNGK